MMKKLFSSSDNLDIKFLRYYLVGAITHFFGVTVHAFWIVLFYLIGAPVLSIFNVFSVTIFIINILLIRRGYYSFAVTLAVLEIVTHQLLCVVYLGWDASFQYYIISILILPFIAENKNTIHKFTMASFCVVSYLFAVIFLKNTVPVYEIVPAMMSFFKYSNIIFALIIVIVCAYYFNVSVNKAEELAEQEFNRAENLLHNILPVPIAERLKKETGVIADGFASATVFFLDLVGFTEFSTTKTPEALVDILNKIFSIFDDLTDQYNIEKIKTIGDAYMAAAGIPKQTDLHAEIVANFALELSDRFNGFNKATGLNLGCRIGINSGHIVAGVIGRKKFIYDLWGDTVNIASRMESHGQVGKIQVSESTYNLINDKFNFEDRGEIKVKGKGLIHTYFLLSKK